MEPHWQRVLDEKAALDEKTGKLRAFLAGVLPVSVSPMERQRLEEQLGHMEQYSNILGERLFAAGHGP